MKPYAELLEFNQPSPIRKEGFTKIRDQYWYALNRSMEGGYKDPERIVEFAGRSDYGPKNAEKLGSDDTIIRRWIDSGHHSMLEFASATFYIECSRVVSHELIRHRLASYQQESQRYVKYEESEYGDLFYVPEVDSSGSDSINAKIEAEYKEAFGAYKILREAGVKAQLARYVLPNATKTRLVMKANLREWRHIVNLRTSKAAQPEMQELMVQIKEQLEYVFPNIMYKATEGDEIR